MASEALLVILALIGIGIIVVGVLLILQPARVEKKVIIKEDEGRWHRRWWRGGWDGLGRGYSHVPVRPVLLG
jgi:hypothetical protein